MLTYDIKSRHTSLHDACQRAGLRRALASARWAEHRHVDGSTSMFSNTIMLLKIGPTPRALPPTELAEHRHGDGSATMLSNTNMLPNIITIRGSPQRAPHSGPSLISMLW